MNIRKMKKAELVEFACKLNKELKLYDKIEILQKTKLGLRTIIHECMEYVTNPKLIKKAIIIDIKSNLYLLHGMDFTFNWTVYKPLNTKIFIRGQKQFKESTFEETYHIRDNAIWDETYINTTLRGTVESQRQQVKVSLYTFKPEKLQGFYERFKKETQITPIFDKINGIIQEYS